MAARARRAGASAWPLLQHAVADFFDDRCPQFAAGISFYALFSIFPVAILLTAVFGLVFADADAQQRVVEFLTTHLPLGEGAREDIEAQLRVVTDSSSALGVVALLGILFSASALMGAIRNSLNAVWDTEDQRPPLRGKAIDILLVIGLAGLVGLSLASTLVIQLVADLARELGISGSILGWLVDALGPAVPIALSLIAFTILLRVLPPSVTSLRDVWPGILLASIGYELAKRGFGLYLENFGNYSDVYGSLGAIIAFLVFVYVAAMVFLLGAEASALWPRVRAGEFDDEGSDQPLSRRLLGFLKGLAVRPSETRRR